MADSPWRRCRRSRICSHCATQTASVCGSAWGSGSSSIPRGTRTTVRSQSNSMSRIATVSSSGRRYSSSAASSTQIWPAWRASTGWTKPGTVATIAAMSRSMKNRRTSAGRWLASMTISQSASRSDNTIDECSVVSEKKRRPTEISSRSVPDAIAAKPNMPRLVRLMRLPTTTPMPAGSGARRSRLRAIVISSSLATSLSWSSRSVGVTDV